MLEQIAYEIPKISEKQQIYVAKDLERLSATALHYGEGGGSSGFVGGGFGGISKEDMDKYGIVKTPLMSDSIPKIQPSQNLTIRNLPFSGTQLHIHEGATIKPSSIMDYSRNKHRISSYDAAMADGGKPAYDAMEILDRLNKIREFNDFQELIKRCK